MNTIKLEVGSKLQSHKYQPNNRTKPTNKLRESIRATNGNELMPAIVYRGEIIDGHRRYEACMLEKVPFYYVEAIEEPPSSFIRTLNTTSRQWTTKNYISSNAKMDNNYDILYNFIEDNKIPVGLISSLAGYSEQMLMAGVNIDINYKQLGFRVKLYKNIKMLFPEASANLVHRSLGKMYAVKEFDDKELWKKVTSLEAVDTPELKQHWLIKELSEILGNMNIYESIREMSNSKKGNRCTSK